VVKSETLLPGCYVAVTCWGVEVSEIAKLPEARTEFPWHEPEFRRAKAALTRYFSTSDRWLYEHVMEVNRRHGKTYPAIDDYSMPLSCEQLAEIGPYCLGYVREIGKVTCFRIEKKMRELGFEFRSEDCMT